MIKLVAVDIDGTLLNSQGKILPSTKKAVQKAAKLGVKTVLCSGRPLSGLLPLMNELNIKGPEQYVVTLNGAVVRNADGKILAEKTIDNKTYRQMVAFAKENHLPFNVVDSNSQIVTADREIDQIESYQGWKNHVRILVREPDEMPVDFTIAKGCFVGDPKRLDAAAEKITAKFGKDFSVMRSDPYFIEVMSKQTTKGSGLRELGKIIDVKPSEMMALGDAGNDVAMFKTVGIAFAMGNAMPVAKQAADYITASNNNDGIAKAYQKAIFL